MTDLPYPDDRWDGIEEYAASIDPVRLRATAQRIVDLVLTEDSVYMDTQLSDSVQGSLLVPLSYVARVLDSSRPFEDLVVAVREMRNLAARHLAEMPEELAEMIRALPLPDSAPGDAGQGRP
jgi:hypothetical protein